jgi:hypothetical protein
LINFCLAHDLESQYPDIAKRVKADYKQFPWSNRSLSPRVSFVKQTVSLLDLPLEDTSLAWDTDDLLPT